jgi:transcriptional regulator with XRE-family HTH domain
MREELGLTQMQLAAKARVSRSALARIEQQWTIPTERTALRLRAALGIEKLPRGHPDAPALYSVWGPRRRDSAKWDTPWGPSRPQNMMSLAEYRSLSTMRGPGAVHEKAKTARHGPRSLGNEAMRHPDVLVKHLKAPFAAGELDLVLRRVAGALGIEVSDIPDSARQSPEALAAFQVRMQTFGGDEKAATHVLDRLSPKPRRMEVSGPGGDPVRTTTTIIPPSADGGKSYYERLESCDPEPGTAGTAPTPTAEEILG